MKTLLSATFLLTTLAAQATTLIPPKTLSALPPEMLIRAWSDSDFSDTAIANPIRALRKYGIESENPVIHRDDQGTINIVMDFDADGKVSRTTGDLSRVVEIFSQIDRRNINDDDLLALETLAFNSQATKEMITATSPKIIQIGNGPKIFIHDARTANHFVIPQNPIDISKAKSIEYEAIRVANSTKCCAGGTIGSFSRGSYCTPQMQMTMGC